jgi:membrane protease YdiL (CAAX protease family)
MKLFAWLAVIVASVGVASYFAFDKERAETAWVFIIMAIPTVSIAAASLVYAKKEELIDAWVKPKWGDFTRGFVATILMFGAVLAVTKVVMPAGSPRALWLFSLYMQLGAPKLAEHATLVAGAIAVMAVAEELVWRGLVTTLLAERLGSRTAWLYSAVLYALAHVPSMWALRSPLGALNPILPLAALGAGLAWGAMARGFGRLAPGMLAHGLFDWCVLMMFPLWSMKQGG